MAYGNPYAPVLTQVSIPFSNPIPGGLKNGKQIHIQGIIQNNPGANGFSINLCEGPELYPNCALHFNPRFLENCIVRNAMLQGSWGPEERQGGLPIMKEQVFEVIIVTSPTAFMIAVNGRHFTEFNHRFPLEQIKYLFINGNYLKINFIRYDGGSADMDTGSYGLPPYGFAQPAHPPPPYTPANAACQGNSNGGFSINGDNLMIASQGEQTNKGRGVDYVGLVNTSRDIKCQGGFVAQSSDMSIKTANRGVPHDNTMYNPPIPLTLGVAGGKMQPNKMIFINGLVGERANRFSVNLMTGQSVHSDIAFHFDVRLSYGDCCNVIVRNTRTNGLWGKEERAVSHFPFSPNAPFEMVITATRDSYKVTVNKTPLVVYRHRIHVEKAIFLNITGDIHISSLRFQ